MIFYADSADTGQIRKMEELGILKGITTNPAILAKESEAPLDVIRRLCREFPQYPVFAQIHVGELEEMLEESQKYEAVDERVVIKIPACVQGFKTLYQIRKETVFQNEICVTTVFTAAEALLAAAAGADYVAPYVGDIYQLGYDGQTVLKEMVLALKGTKTKVLAAAVERAEDMVAAALAGADIATVTPGAANQVLEKPYPVTEWYLRLFAGKER
ncbi:MAG TPA: hypothetical protein IAB84_08595 [Candidatus Choladousia intestinigallinarum]|nr:hypothetical protein [Candidatus Choladousia intestinigallinarum]